MAQITEDYVSYETAKLLKEKGFNEDSWFHYDTDGYIVTRGYRLNLPEDIPAWTIQMTMKWLRKVHNLHITVEIGFDGDYFFFVPSVIRFSNKPGEYEGPFDEREFNTYEEACENTIRYCLENLI